ncbi:hypothetical protein ONE63_011485 [Megalurothrips usitatus]|uniref:Uncharacterized protein n=1 Tax=Megalurothrips usitatus TaxID=439358 RepID=A0AAV7X2A9_9NEOP|nr:hypothetical protein ONE63_011485 [Megalurothrips usitatus]
MRTLGRGKQCGSKRAGQHISSVVCNEVYTRSMGYDPIWRRILLEFSTRHKMSSSIVILGQFSQAVEQDLSSASCILNI